MTNTGSSGEGPFHNYFGWPIVGDVYSATTTGYGLVSPIFCLAPYTLPNTNARPLYYNLPYGNGVLIGTGSQSAKHYSRCANKQRAGYCCGYFD